MIQFAQSGDLANIVGTIDEDGDYAVRINSIPVFFISKDSGELVLFWLSDTEQKELQRLGFKTKHNNLAICGYRLNGEEEDQDGEEAAGF